MKVSDYAVKLSWPMVSAMVDIHSKYDGEDSYRWNGGTLGALAVRGLILTDGANSRMTKKGLAYMDMALHLWSHNMKSDYKSGVSVPGSKKKARSSR